MKVQNLDLVSFLAYSLLLIQPCLGQAAFNNAIPTANHTLSDSTSLTTADASNATNSSSAALAAGHRPVYLVMNVRLTAAQTFPPTYEKLFPAYASLHFNATPTDGPLDIQLVNKNGQDLIRVTDWGLQNSDKPMGVPQPGYLTDYFELFGKANMTNNQILHNSTGEGLIHDVWTKNTSLALKAYNSVDFMQACIAQLGLGTAPSETPSAIIPTRIAQAQTYWRNTWVAEKVVSHYSVWLDTLQGWGPQVQISRAEFNYQVGADASAGMVQSRPVPLNPVPDKSNSSLVESELSDLAAPEMTETYQASDNTTASAPQYQWIYAQAARNNSLQPNNNLQSNSNLQRRDPPADVPKQFLVYHPGEGDFAIASEYGANGRPRQPYMKEGDVVPPEGRTSNAVVELTNRQIAISFARAAGAFGAIAGIIAIAVVDFGPTSDGTSLMCGLFSLITGVIGLLFFFTGIAALPEITMLSAVFIGEIPRFMQSAGDHTEPNPSHGGRGYGEDNWKRAGPSASTPALRTDVQGILQWTIVGDKDKLGNEKCLAKGYKDCTIVYGPYLLATALQIENFDAFALLIHFNEGYPMSMPDLAKAFKLSTDPDAANSVATIDCSHSTIPDGRFSFSNPNTATIEKQCDKPRFTINRSLITVPIINEPADQVYTRLMPTGNCTLVGDVTGGEKYPAYNLTLTGGNVAIACGIVGALDINGTAVALPTAIGAAPAVNSSLSLTSPGNQSSDGSSGRAYTAPPPPTPFQPTLNLTNSLCMTASDNSNLCFVNGTYSAQSGSLGFSTSKATSLSIGPASRLVVTESVLARSKGAIYAHAPAPPPTYDAKPVTYTTNQTATDTQFAADMANMLKHNRDNTFTVHVPSDPDAACLYTQPRGRGDVACFGPGGGDLPAGLKGKVLSVKCLGRASVEMFANGYGDAFSHVVDTEEDDLSVVKTGGQVKFADVVASIWVYLEPEAVG